MGSEEINGAEILDTFKALRVFDTMRSDLALFHGLSRRAALEESSYQGEDLGFLCTTDDGLHLQVHNWANQIIIIALVYQVYEGYKALKKLNPNLVDTEIESYVDSLGEGILADQLGIIRRTVFSPHEYLLQTQWRLPKAADFVRRPRWDDGGHGRAHRPAKPFHREGIRW